MNCNDNKFQELTLNEISLGKGSYGIAASAVEKSDELYTYLRITDITDDGTLKKDSLMSVDDENAKKYLLEPNDIVFARTGNSTGRSYFYDGTDGELVYAGFLIKFSLNDEVVNPRFIRYYTLSDEYKNWVQSFSTGSTRGNINAKTYGDMKIKLPNRKQQDFLVSILSVLDKKIELNNEMNKTLEEMAQTLFKRWFVDFEFPNEDGEPYKSSGGEMVESELGMIPEKWKVATLDCFADFKYGKMPKKQFISEQGYPIFSGYKITGYYNEYMFMEPQLIVVARGVGGTGDVKFTPAMCYLTNLSIAILSNNRSLDEYLYYYLKRANLRNLDTGSAQSQITINDLKRYKILMPNLEIIRKFHEVIVSFINQQRQIEKENNDLEILKNSLLPKLMSGEIRVEDIKANL